MLKSILIRFRCFDLVPFIFFSIDSTGARVEVAKPIVDMDGDEMTRVR